MSAKKIWIRPEIFNLSHKINSGTYSHGAERVLTCGGNVLTTKTVVGFIPSTRCTSFSNSKPIYNCAGIITYLSGIGIGNSYGDATIANAPCS